jgi:hypothetical protein
VDVVYYGLCFLMLAAWAAANVSYHQHTARWMLFFPNALSAMILAFFLVVRALVFARLSSQRALGCLLEVGLKLWFVFYFAYALSPILLTTPFPLQDQALYRFDLWLHVDVYAWMNAIVRVPWAVSLLSVVYHAWLSFAGLILLCLVFVGAFSMARTILHMALLGLVLASCVFYFIPTLGPSALRPDFWLATPAHCVRLANCGSIVNAAQYHALQQGSAHRLGTVFHAGFVAFPSVHFFVALLMCYACCCRIPRLIIPACLYLLLLALATLFLDHHFLSDLLGGALLLIIVLALARVMGWSKCAALAS